MRRPGRAIRPRTERRTGQSMHSLRHRSPKFFVLPSTSSRCAKKCTRPRNCSRPRHRHRMRRPGRAIRPRRARRRCQSLQTLRYRPEPIFPLPSTSCLSAKKCTRHRNLCPPSRRPHAPRRPREIRRRIPSTNTRNRQSLRCRSERVFALASTSYPTGQTRTPHRNSSPPSRRPTTPRRPREIRRRRARRTGQSMHSLRHRSPKFFVLPSTSSRCAKKCTRHRNRSRPQHRPGLRRQWRAIRPRRAHRRSQSVPRLRYRPEPIFPLPSTSCPLREKMYAAPELLPPAASSLDAPTMARVPSAESAQE